MHSHTLVLHPPPCPFGFLAGISVSWPYACMIFMILVSIETYLISALEKAATRPLARRAFISEGDSTFAEACMAKYGDDYKVGGGGTL